MHSAILVLMCLIAVTAAEKEIQNLGIAQTLRLPATSNTVNRVDVEGVRSTFVKCVDNQPPTCGRWVGAKGRAMDVATQVTFKDDVVDILLGYDDDHSSFSVKGGKTVQVFFAAQILN